MNKEILEQYDCMRKEYEDIKRRVAQIENDIARYDKRYIVQDSVTGGSGGTQHFTIKGFPYPEYSRKLTCLQQRKLRMEQLRQQLEEEIGQVEQYINTIEDSRKRLILRYRYIDGLSWKDVSNMLGSGNNADSVRIEIERFLKKQ